MTIAIGTVRDLCTSILNASTTYGSNDDDLRHPTAEIDAAIRVADNDIIMALLSTPGHPDRSKFTVTGQAVAHAGLIPGHIGEVGMILVAGKAATPMEAAEIERLRTNFLSLVDVGPFYDIKGDPPRLFFVGASATADIINYTDSGSTLQSPDQYLGAIFRRAMMILFSKEGAEVQASQLYLSAAQADIAIIKAGGRPSGMQVEAGAL